jgi:pantoate--beta-alanine ligase
MAPRPRIARTVPDLRRTIARWRAAGEKIALVPTMGALHAGHLALVRLARRRARRVVVSVFVNPEQFAPNEDFASYPRDFDADVAILAETGIDLVWAPPVEAMYPPGFTTRVVLEGPAAVGLEDRFRPHFFTGVATVVTKLLTQCAPDLAIFGEKDFQQLRVISRLAADLDLPVKIVGAPTVREKDGLALSSRNAYLTPPERAVAATLHRVLKESATKINAGAALARVLAAGAAEIEQAGFTVDYFEARHAGSLQPLGAREDGPLRLLVAARLGRTRLIDNVAV